MLSPGFITVNLELFGTKQVITSLADLAQAVSAADFDGDGDADVLSASPIDGSGSLVLTNTWPDGIPGVVTRWFQIRCHAPDALRAPRGQQLARGGHGA